MKRLNVFLRLLFLLPIIIACEDESRIILDLTNSIPAKITSPASGENLELLAINAEELIKINFSPVVLEVDAATEYSVEISSFENFSEKRALESEVNVKKGEATFSTIVLNKALLASEYEPTVSAPVYLRLVTRVLDSKFHMYSDTLKINVIPYEIASDGSTDDGTRIYIVGAAVPAGWDAANALEMENIAPNTYRVTTTFSVERFRFLAQQDWGDDYNFPFFTSVPEDLVENARQSDREDGDENLWFKGEPSEYVVTVNLETKTLTMVTVSSDGSVDDGTRIYIVGAAVPAGWDPSEAIEMINIAPNRYRATTDFVIERFRFLAQQDWGDGYNFPFFTSVPEDLLENARQPDRDDGDENLWFKGPDGSYTITIDIEEKWITMY